MTTVFATSAATNWGGAGPNNGNFTAGEVYTVDKTVPVVNAIVRADPNPTSEPSVNFTLTFSENVTGIDTGDFQLAVSGLSGAEVTSVTGSGDSYAVTVSTGTGDGTLGLNLLDDDSILDGAGNRLGGTGAGNGNFTGQAYTIDRIPEVVSVVRTESNPTNVATVNFAVTFSENVTGVDAADFALTTSGLTGSSVQGVSGSGSNYTVTAATGAGDGTLRLDVQDNDSIVDATGNTLASGYTAGDSYTVDKTAPTSQLAYPSDGGVYGPTMWADAISGTATDTGGANLADVRLSIRRAGGNYWDGSGFLSSSEVFLVATDAANWSLTFPDANFPADDDYVIRVRTSDSAGNTATTAGASFTFDSTPPTAPAVTGITDDTGASNSDGITNDATLSIGGTAETANGIEVFLDGTSIGTTAADAGGVWSFDYSGTTLAEGSYSLTAKATDDVGNVSTASASFDLTVDLTPPPVPVISGITEDTGTAGDGVTTDTTLVISGTAEAGSNVQLWQDAVSIGTTIADGTGAWSFDHTDTALALGSDAFTAQATDAAGNLGTISSPFQVTIVSPDINLQGNRRDIVDGDTSPSTVDHTDFGSDYVGYSHTR